MFLRTAYIYQWGFMTFKTGYWMFKVCIPYKNIEIKCTRYNNFVFMRNSDAFDSFIMTVKFFGQFQSTLPHVIKSKDRIIRTSNKKIQWLHYLHTCKIRLYRNKSPFIFFRCLIVFCTSIYFVVLIGFLHTISFWKFLSLFRLFRHESFVYLVRWIFLLSFFLLF